MGHGQRAMMPADITRIRWVSDPQISPDGGRVAFVVTTLSEERDEYLSRIWMVDAAGGEPRCFTTGAGRDTAPRWSPDGAWLAFLAAREPRAKAQLHVMPAGGGEPIRITGEPHGVSVPVWAPDSSRLAFVARVGPAPAEGPEKSRPARIVTSVRYRFNGEGFIHDRPPHIFAVDRDGGASRQLTDGDFVDGEPAWSPDGRQLAFTSARHADRDGDDIRDLWVVSAQGGEPRRLTDTSALVTGPAFSPDGRTLAYVARRGPNAFADNHRVLTLPLEGGKPQELAAGLDRSLVALGDAWVIWSADGQWLLFAVEDGGRVSVNRVRATGAAAPVPVAAGERAVSGFSLARAGTVALASSTPAAPAELSVVAMEGGAERGLTDLNRGWRAEVALSVPERFRYERAGLTVDGWVMRPVGAEAGQRHPVLLNIHGGPHAQYGVGFFDEFQVYAGAGYAVLFTNPRGSRGYGQAFARAVHGDWGGGDVADVMAGLDEALRRFDFLDGERLGVMGGSYGGFATSWIVGHESRFRAACSERAVNDQRTMFGTSDIGYLFNPVALGGALPWEDPARYAERSPLTYAPHIRTPLLILHSEEDYRCPIEQAEQLFVALRRLGREAVLVRFPGENHELSRSGTPRHRLERFRIILDWFARHLAPTPTETAAGAGSTAGPAAAPSKEA
jgi:dipeptidyl aminopeptidase/acylaminoacyl peptidase